MTNVTIPSDLFYNLIENTIECLNKALNKEDIHLIEIHQKEIEQCKKIQSEEKNILKKIEDIRWETRTIFTREPAMPGMIGGSMRNRQYKHKVLQYYKNGIWKDVLEINKITKNDT